MGRPGDLGLQLTKLKKRNLPLISQLVYMLSVFPLFYFLGVYQTLCLASALLRGNKEKGILSALKLEDKKENISPRCQ